MKFILILFNKWGLFILFSFIALEYACFPLPSEIILPFLGYIIEMNDYSLLAAIIMSTIMGYLGCLFCYAIGYYGGNKIYSKIYNKIPSWRKALNFSNNFFDKYGNLSIMIGRIIPLCRTYVSFFAGVFKQGLVKYSFYSIIGVLIWNSLLVSLGYYLSDKWVIIEIYYNNYKFFIILFILFIIGAYFVNKWYKKVRKGKNINGD